MYGDKDVVKCFLYPFIVSDKNSSCLWWNWNVNIDNIYNHREKHMAQIEDVLILYEVEN